MQRLINWFEIPAVDFNRARAFYESVFAVRLREEPYGEGRLGVFPYADGATGGAIAQMAQLKPAQNGIVIYLDGGPDLATPLGRVEGAGGTIVMPKTGIGEHGHIALFRDSEGNVVGLHSMR